MNNHPCPRAPRRTSRLRPVPFLRRAVVTGAGALAVLAAAGCEDVDGHRVSTATGDSLPADQARLLSEALMSDRDLPAGWELDFQPRPDVLAPGCGGIDVVDEQAAIGRAPRLTHRDEEIENLIVVFDTDDAARAHLDRFTSAGTGACLQGFVERSALDGRGIDIEALDVRLDRTAPVHDVDDAATYRVSTAIEALGVDLDVHLDIVAVRAGRSIAYFSFLELGERLTDPQPDLIDRIVRRLEAVRLT